MLHTSLAQVEVAADALRRHWGRRPRVGLVCGSGVSPLARGITVEAQFGYDEVPHMRPATAPGHAGRWICGTFADTPLVAMDGRLHLYEGCTAAEVAFGTRVMHALGIELLIISSAAGGMNPRFRVGDIVIVDDHINFTFRNPLVGPHDTKSAVAYPDMSAYDSRLIDEALSIARRHDVTAYRGVYVGVMGPNYETRAEYRLLRSLGGDVVGMSTVCEVIAAAQCGLKVLVLAVVTNVGLSDAPQPASAGQVLSAAAAAADNVQIIVRGIVEHTSRQTEQPTDAAAVK